MSDPSPSLAVIDTGGSGAPLVFLHGAAWAGVSWHRQLAAFGAAHRCLAFDLPGHGASRGIRWTTMDAAADAVAQTIVDLTPGPVHLVGFSLGADVGIRLLARHPALVHDALLTGAVTMPDTALWRMLDAASWPLVALPATHRLISRRMGLDRAAYAQHLRSSAPLRVGDFRRLSTQILAGTPVEDLRGCTAPVLALAGARESRLARRSVVRLAAHVPHGLSAEVAGAGHDWHVREWELFNRVLAQWIGAPLALPGALGADSRP